MKNKIMWMVIGWVLVAGVLWTVSAYSTNIWSPIQFVKQLFVSPTGQVWDVKGAYIKLDGTNWRIDAKSVYVNGKEVATKSDLNNATKPDLTAYAKKSDLNSYATKSYVESIVNALKKTWSSGGPKFVTSCNAANLGKHTANGDTCKSYKVTNDEDCIRNKGDWWTSSASVQGEYNVRERCKDGWERVKGGVRHYQDWTETEYLGRKRIYYFW